jgi:cytidine deaminase
MSTIILDELSTDQQLMQEATSGYQAPCTLFKFYGRRLENGVAIYGNNQENAAYPSGLCAERVAILPQEQITQVLPLLRWHHCQLVDDSFEKPVPPLAACPTIAEYESRQSSPIEIFFMVLKVK